MDKSTDPGILEIHHIEGARSFRVAWLCEEIGLPYRLLFETGDMLASVVRIREEFPLMPMAPVLYIKGQPMVESGAMLEVLTTRYGPELMPDIHSPDYLRHEQWLHFAEGSMMSRIVSQRLVSFASGVDVDKLPRGYVAGESSTNFESIGPYAIFAFLDDYLARFPYFGGANFSSADIMMHFAVRSAYRVVWIDYEDYANISRWKALIEQRPAFVRATEACVPGGTGKDGMAIGAQHPFTLRPSAEQ